MSEPTSTPAPAPPRPLVELGIGAAWLVGLAAVLLIVDRLLGRAALAVPIGGAVIVDFAASRAGVKWDPNGPTPWQDIARRMGRGAVIALIVGIAVALPGLAMGWLAGGMATPGVAILLALLRAAATAARDEMLYRGMPLAAAERAGVHPLAARAFTALAGVATVALAPGVTAAALVLGVASGWLFGALWQRDRAGWAPVGAHAMWILFTGSILHGGLFDADWVVGNLSTGTSASGAPAWLASAAMIAMAAALDARRPPISPGHAPVAPPVER